MRWDLVAMFGLAAATWLGVTFVTAPYGRHERKGWGPTVSSRVGWVVMESPAVFAFLAFFATGERPFQIGALVLVGLWLTHYVQRTFIFPFRMRADGKRMPVAIMSMAIGFNLFNAFLNGRWLSSHDYDASWLVDPRFIVGTALFVTGYSMNLWADATLFRLRAPGESGYKIPRGGLYEYVSCPNYLGELVEWLGFALAAWSLAGLAFAAYTAANLAPRALSNHRWYRTKFADYPSSRKALIPFVW